MKNRKGFTLIGLLALIGLRVYDGDQQVKGKNVIVQEKAKNVIVKANFETIQSLIQAELADKDINCDNAIYSLKCRFI